MNADGTQQPWYEIRVRGHLNPGWAVWFEGLTVTQRADGTTALAGAVADQPALYGLLKKIRDLGLFLVSVTCVNYESLQ